MGELFIKEDNLFQIILNIFRNSTLNTLTDEIPKKVQRAKAELLVIQSHEIFECVFNNNGQQKLDFIKMYKLRTEKKLAFVKLIVIEERKPSDITMSHTQTKGILCFSFAAK